jgi:hypothetical protein
LLAVAAEVGVGELLEELQALNIIVNTISPAQ